LRMPQSGTLRIGNRRGGEHCHPAGRSHSNSLKKCLQEFGLEPWWRDRVPLIFLDQQLIAVADLWVCENWQVQPEEIGIKIHWHDNSL
jgi:tRNA(Ile)-lysidine synthase